MLIAASTYQYWTRRLVIAALACSLSGCGFHLRGFGGDETTVPASVRVTTEGDGEMARVLSRTFEDAGIEVLEDTALAVNVMRERTVRRPLAASSRGGASEYELMHEVTFTSAGPGDRTLGPLTLDARRTYSFDRTSLVGNASEEELLKIELRREIAGAIVRRVSAFAATE